MHLTRYCPYYSCFVYSFWPYHPYSGVELTVAWSPFVTNMSTGVTNFQNFSGFRCHYWRLSCSNVYSYGKSRLVSSVCSVCTQSDQLQTTGAPSADTAYLLPCFNENCSLRIAQEICSVVPCCCLRAQDSVQFTC